MGQPHVSNITLINIEREYANSVVNNDIDHTIDIFGHQNGKDTCFFGRVLCTHMIDSYVRNIFSLDM